MLMLYLYDRWRKVRLSILKYSMSSLCWMSQVTFMPLISYVFILCIYIMCATCLKRWIKLCKWKVTTRRKWYLCHQFTVPLYNVETTWWSGKKTDRYVGDFVYQRHITRRGSILNYWCRPCRNAIFRCATYTKQHTNSATKFKTSILPECCKLNQYYLHYQQSLWSCWPAGEGWRTQRSTLLATFSSAYWCFPLSVLTSTVWRLGPS